MAKKKYTLYLPVPLARKLDQVARERHGAKSALVEEALRANLEPQQHAGVEEGLARRLNDLNRAVTAVGRDVVVASETLALFVRYFLTITPPLPHSEQEPARLLGKERIQVFLDEVGRRVAEGRRHASEVLGTIPRNDPDLLVARSGNAEAKQRSDPRNQQLASNGHALGTDARGQAAEPGEGDGHG
jgi:hypothetical protein